MIGRRVLLAVILSTQRRGPVSVDYARVASKSVRETSPESASKAQGQTTTSFGAVTLTEPGVASQSQEQSRSTSGPLNGRNLNSVVTLSKPGVAADSNGLMHGLGDHVENSVSLDGQPQTDRQSKIFSNAIPPSAVSANGQSANSAPAPMIARTVSLSIVVKDFKASRTAVDEILKRNHGYAAQLGVSTPENAPRSLQASLRFPTRDLSAAISELKALGRLETEAQSGEEVTQQHADLVARLKVARATEERFVSILESRTGDVYQVLQVEQGIERVRGDIERMEAEQKNLEHRVDFVTVNLQLTEEYKVPLNPPAPSIAIRFHNALVQGYRNASETLLGVLLFFAEYTLTLLIWGMILVLPAFLLWKRYRRSLAGAQQI
jgi:hypothetical protein